MSGDDSLADVEQLPSTVNEITGDPPDEPGAEMFKEARIWRTYVKETDRWDKDLMEGRNNSLDVLLIFVSFKSGFSEVISRVLPKAALFSAISTAFVIESLNDLKPDPTEESARTLLLISQTLSAMTGNSSLVPTAAQGSSDSTTFSPPSSAVIVNILWLLSLSLSVAVSLIAMLAKEWCHKFMSGRSGQAYEQARRRQLRWNGMEKWRMRDALTYLPGAMHLALLLFAAGLCVYLWDINVNVAIPVIVVSAVATLAYAFTTILPLFDAFCPYSTPVTVVITKIISWIPLVSEEIVSIILSSLSTDDSNRPRVELALNKITNGLQPGDDNTDVYSLDNNDQVATMDAVTSQMLAWLLTNCEDSRPINTALQAIAGAKHDLPHKALAECGALQMVFSRLSNCVQWDQSAKRYQVKDLSLLPMALTYCRAYSVLMSGDGYENLWYKWKARPLEAKHYDWVTRTEWKDSYMIKVHADLLERARLLPNSSSLVAPTIAAAMIFCHWDQSLQPDSIAPKIAASMLAEHIQGGSNTLPTPTLAALVESAAHYLITFYAREDSQAILDNSLPMLLAQIFAGSYTIAPDVAYATSVTLAAATLAANPYPGGEQPSGCSYAREARAAQLVLHYRSTSPGKHLACSLFAFGLIGLLPRLCVESSNAQNIGTLEILNQFLENHFSTVFSNQNEEMLIHTLSHGYSFNEHLALSACRCLLATTHHSFSPADGESTVFDACSILLLPRINLDRSDIRLYTAAAIVFCRTELSDLSELCLNIMNTQPIPTDFHNVLEPFDGKYLLQHLCYALLSASPSAVSVAIPHFRLLVASIMLSDRHPLHERQSILRRVLGCRDEFLGLVPAAPILGPVSIEVLVLHIKEHIDECSALESLLPTVQHVVDFCSIDPNLPPSSAVSAENSVPSSSGTESAEQGVDILEWHLRLQQVKDSFRPVTLGVEGSKEFDMKDADGQGAYVGSPCWPVREDREHDRDDDVSRLIAGAYALRPHDRCELFCL
ncbi:hypothetical protein FRC12_003505 [Ceratobasidium sp. 428]|nr:hypothetical protein FRC12_003505 [Ceratobasidium sp. 428]